MISDKNISEKSIVVGLFAIVAAAILLSIGVNDTVSKSNNSSYQAQAQRQGLQTNENNTIRVEAGGGNSTAPLTVYVPQSIKIEAGQSVNWYNPTPVDSTGKNVTYLPPNANYTMDGTESYINSAWLWPQGQVPPGAPPLTTFTVTFENPGIYDYVCTVHPWMTGSVEVT